MRSLKAHGFGRVFTAAEVHTAESGNPFVILTVQFEERILNKGTPYAQRVTVRSFDPQDIAKADQLEEGVFIVFDGDCDAQAEKSETGWWYANPRVTGRILQILDPKVEVLRG
jgi:hypothetical protein